MADKIFISYRRDDSSAAAGRVNDRLEQEFGRESLFMDVDAIPFGVDFVEVLSAEVAKCDVLLAIIGPHWLDAKDEDGNRRLDNEHDFVRIEIAAALRRSIPVIPILLEGTRVPKAVQLPDELKSLARRNALDVRHGSFRGDMDRLVRSLRGTSPPAPPPPKGFRSWFRVQAAPHTQHQLSINLLSKDEFSPPITPTEASVVKVPLTPSDKPITSQPGSLPEPPVSDQPIAATEHEARLPLTGNGETGGRAKSNSSGGEPEPISAAKTLFGTFSAVAALLAGTSVYFYLRPLKPGPEFTDCANCPVMVVVPPGKFLMGSPESEPKRHTNEGPQREVKIAKPFAVSKYEVTFAEWDACSDAGACPRVTDQWGRGQMPVINVSWDYAKQYVGWLSRLTGKEYRLLTEAEWEYAARAGTTTAYFWGNDPGSGNANCDGCGSQWNKQTAPVGSLKPNAFGLYDMAGNVWEWVEDFWHDNYQGAPTGGSAWVQGGDAGVRAVRGGSWGSYPQDLRAASRLRDPSGIRYIDMGFRVARTLAP